VVYQSVIEKANNINHQRAIALLQRPSRRPSLQGFDLTMANMAKAAAWEQKLSILKY
jgi:hypothetical protein